jgi:adenylylsulfate kinase
MHQKTLGQVVWFTGLSGSGKTTLCNLIASKLKFLNCDVHILDGDEIRKGLCCDLSFSAEDRLENVRRISSVASLLSKQGAIVLVAVISPLRVMRQKAREATLIFTEVYVNAPLHVCEVRDPKGLYLRARAGEINGFTGIDSPYEPPVNPDITCWTATESVSQSALKVLRAMRYSAERVSSHTAYDCQRAEMRLRDERTAMLNELQGFEQ